MKVTLEFDWSSESWQGDAKMRRDVMQTYCKIFLDTQLPKDEVLGLVASITRGSVELRSVSSPRLEIDVVENDDFEPAYRQRGEDRFLFYPYYLDVDARSGIERAEYISALCELLDGLRNVSADAVPACDFEEELAKRVTPATRVDGR